VIRKYAAADIDHICVHQVGRDQKGFFEFDAEEILPQMKSVTAPRGRRWRRRRQR
jgi:hypothetical protein